MRTVADTDCEQSELSGVGVVEDIALPWSRVFGFAYFVGLVACVAFILVTFWIAWLFEIDRLAAVLLVAVPLMIVGEPVSNYIRREKARRVIAAMKATGQAFMPCRLFETLIRRMPMLGPDKPLVREFVSTLVREGHAGLTIRLPMGRMPPVPAALEVPFDPRPLNDEDRSARSLLVAQGDGRGDSAAPDAKLETHEAPYTTLVRRWRSNAPLWAIAGGMAFCTIGLVIALRLRNAGLAAAVLVLFALLVVFTLMSPRHIFRREDWFLVPGGLAVRSRFRSEPTVRVFDRRESVLCIAPTMPQTRCWAVHVANAQGHSRAVLSPDEVTLLLRAWLSPLRAPGSERISDLM